jgi:hypothetical protein
MNLKFGTYIDNYRADLSDGPDNSGFPEVIIAATTRRPYKLQDNQGPERGKKNY